MTLRDVAIWMSFLVVGLTAELIYVWLCHDTALALRNGLNRERAAITGLADELVQSTAELSDTAYKFVLTGDIQAKSQYRYVRVARDGPIFGAADPSRPLGNQDVEPAPFELRISGVKLQDSERQMILDAWADAIVLADRQHKAMLTRGDGAVPITGSNDRLPPRVVAARDILSDPENERRRTNIRLQARSFATRTDTRLLTAIAYKERRIEIHKRYMLIMFLTLVSGLMAGIGYVTLNILPGFDHVRQALTRLAERDERIAVTGITREDEVGEIARAVVALRDRSQSRVSLLKHMAFYDSLTGLPNRSMFRERLEALLSSRHLEEDDVAAFMVDLDKFKEINDIYGHPAGDLVLQVTGKRLASVAGKASLVARFGGDEFGLVGQFPKTGNTAFELAERIVDELGKPIRLDDATVVRCGGTVGVAVTSTTDTTPDLLISHADMALYDAKEHGRGRAQVFIPGMDDALRARRELEEDLRKAQERDELTLRYQPQIDLKTGRIVGFEALLRWIHPLRGVVSPADFIPIAEESQQILDIGRWTIHEASRVAAGLPEPVRMSINLSPSQFYDTGLASYFAETREKFDLEPNRFELEVTESVLIDDRALAFQIMHQMHMDGIRLALDDFGTGFSSLSYLREFPFDKIKIDRSFIRSLGEGGSARSIVQSVIGLGHALGMSVIAEGVETDEQRDILRADGCDEIQGYLIGRPLAAKDAERMLGQRKSKMLAAFDAELSDAEDTGGSQAGLGPAA